MSEPAAFDACAATYDAALNRGLSLSGESKEYFAHRRIEWLSHIEIERQAVAFERGSGRHVRLLVVNGPSSGSPS